MLNPLLRAEWLREGRSNRLAVTIIFYNAILALIIILFMVFNTESFQEGYYFDPAVYRFQYFIISAIQMGLILLFMPFSVWGLFIRDNDEEMIRRYRVIPGFSRKYVMSKIGLIMSIALLLYVSSLPVLSLACIYSGVTWTEILRLGLMLMFFSFWSGSIAVYAFIRRQSGIRGFSLDVFINLFFFMGTLLLSEFIHSVAALSQGAEAVADSADICMLLVSMNPLVCLTGYLANITGDNSVINAFCSHIGYDNSGEMFTFTFFKLAGLAGILIGLLFLYQAVAYLDRDARRRDALVKAETL